jgi:hypothetical protein
MDSPETSSHHVFLQRFSPGELAIIVLVLSVMSALVWYKKFYHTPIAVVPSNSSAHEEPAETPLTVAPSGTPTANPFAAQTNPFANAYQNPFAQ